MSLNLKIALIIFGLAYLISPVDIIPDLLLPYVGWIDDGAVIATIIYLIRFGKLPNFIFKSGKKTKTFSKQKQNGFQDNTDTGEKANTENSSTKSPYEILGVRQNASKKEIQSAYKEAIKKYHPDKLSHLGEEFSNLANEKFLEIQNAYDTMIKKFNR